MGSEFFNSLLPTTLLFVPSVTLGVLPGLDLAAPHLDRVGLELG
jgi:hypothetical protein